jgi:general stress protein 26
MTELQPDATRISEFSEADAPDVSWSEVEEILRSAEMFWLSTVRRDGRPHVAPLPAVWQDGQLHFCTGAHEQKARNLEHDPRCALTTGTNRFRSGTDVVVEGKAGQVTDTPTLTRLAAAWKDKLDWDFTVDDGVFLDTDAADARALVFAVAPVKALAFTKAPYSQTRFTFARRAPATTQ